MRGAEGGWLSAPARWSGGGRRKELTAIGLVEALHFTTLKIAVIGVKCCPANKHLYPCDNNWGARGNRPADRVAKPLSLKGDNGFRGERAGDSNNSKMSQRSERTGLVREQVSWIVPESQRTEPGQRLKTQLKKGRSLFNSKDIDNSI